MLAIGQLIDFLYLELRPYEFQKDGKIVDIDNKSTMIKPAPLRVKTF